MVMTIAPFGLAIRTGPCSNDRRITCQHVAPWQAAFLTPIHLSWQGVATHVDATETDTEYKLRVDLPGFRPQEVDIELQGGKLNITAKKDEGQTAGAGKVPARKATPSFSRSFAFPDNIGEDDISASLDKGVLTVTLPKTEPVQAGPVKATVAEAAAPAEADPKTANTAQGQCTYRPWGRCRK